jgi:cobalt-precorrin-5B (C1)-methyltransferase
MIVVKERPRQIMTVKKKKLRSGYTTGACAAAAAKAAALLLLQNTEHRTQSTEHRAQSTEHRAQNTDKRKEKDAPGSGLRSMVPEVEIPFPDGTRVKFKIHNSELKTLNSQIIARASVVKDAGDDPDVTHGAEIIAEVRVKSKESRVKKDLKSSIIIRGGAGVGIVTKAVPVGEHAINPVPRKMIEDAVMETVQESLELRVSSYELKNKKKLQHPPLEITISVPNGEELAKKTLNSRLGIVGGISILGTTGIVRPVSADAWTATISSSMDVAKATGCREVVLSAGRSSERAHMNRYHFPEESYVLMGDYLEYALRAAGEHDFEKVHLCAQWAKMLKIAMATPQTHVRFGAIDVRKAIDILNSLNAGIPADHEFNTAREIFDYITASSAHEKSDIYRKVCNRAKDYAREIVGGLHIQTHLVSYEKEIIAESA